MKLQTDLFMKISLDYSIGVSLRDGPLPNS